MVWELLKVILQTTKLELLVGVVNIQTQEWKGLVSHAHLNNFELTVVNFKAEKDCLIIYEMPHIEA